MIRDFVLFVVFVALLVAGAWIGYVASPGAVGPFIGMVSGLVIFIVIAIASRPAVQPPMRTGNVPPPANQDRPWERVSEIAGIRVTMSIGEVGSKDHFMTKIVGVTYRRDAVKRARVGDTLLLQPEPENPHDPNAVRVVLERTGEQLGYLGRGRAEYLAGQMSVGAIYASRIETITGGGDNETGLNIRVWRSGWDASKLPPSRVDSPTVQTPKKRSRTKKK